MATQKAQLNYLRMAPRKVRLVADLIRGLSVNDAEAQLLYERRRAAKPLLKLLRSAIADAKNTKQLEPATLFIEVIRVDQGPMLKRSLPRARGMATPIQKKMSHVMLVLGEKADQKPARFAIVPAKKEKLPPKERAHKHDKKEEAGGESAAAKRGERRGVLKRMFRRKSV